MCNFPDKIFFFFFFFFGIDLVFSLLLKESVKQLATKTENRKYALF